MKKIFTGMTAVAFAFSVAGFGLATEKAVAPAASPAAEKAPAASPAAEKVPAASPAAEKVPAASPAAEKAPAAKPSKPKTVLVTGTIEALDAAAGTFTVKGKKGNVDLKAGEKVKLGGYKVGDKVVVKYAEGTASSVKAVKAAKPNAKPMAEPKATPAATPAMPAEKK